MVIFVFWFYGVKAGYRCEFGEEVFSNVKNGCSAVSIMDRRWATDH